MCMCALFASCSEESETAPVDPNPINISQSKRDECTLVTVNSSNSIYYYTSFSAKIYDENGKEVGGGSNLGSYLVPHGGSISVEWIWDHDYYNEHYSGSETVFVGSAYEIICYISDNELIMTDFD